MDELVKKTMESLERRGFHVAYAEKAEQARDMALQMIAPGESQFRIKPRKRIPKCVKSVIY